MATRIADLRLTPKTLDQAQALFDEIARGEIALALGDARTEKRIGQIKAQYEADTAAVRRNLMNGRADLAAFIELHPQFFKDPRKVATSFGTFGLQKASEVVIEDEPRCMAWLLNNGFHECVQTVTKPVRTAIRKLFEAGRNAVPGCRYRSGDTAVMKVEKALIDQAKEEAKRDAAR